MVKQGKRIIISKKSYPTPDGYLGRYCAEYGFVSAYAQYADIAENAVYDWKHTDKRLFTVLSRKGGNEIVFDCMYRGFQVLIVER